MHSSLGWYRVPASIKKLASATTIAALILMSGSLLIPTSVRAVALDCNAAAPHEIVSDTVATFAGDDGAGNAVVVTPTAVTTSAWTASIPGATWIWSTPAIVDGTVDNTETFTRTFTILGTPTGSATLDIAADNYYTVSVNGTPIDGGAGTATDNNFTVSASYPVTNLVNGANTITVVGKNKGIPGDAINNPAGVLFKLSYTSNDCIVKVHMYKYVSDGETTTQVPDDSTAPAFPMNATWQTANLNGGASTSGDYALGNNHGGAALKYAADTSPMAAPADYSTYEVTGGDSPVLATETACAPGKYRLLGYKTGDSLGAAEGAVLSSTVPAFTGLSADKYVIIVNEKCADDVPVQNSCPLPDSLTDETIETLGASPSGEETLQQILDGESYGVNVTTDQKQFQVWNVTPGSSVLIDPIKFVDKFAGHNQVFGYYTNGDTSNFVPVFKTGSITGQEAVAPYNTGPFSVTVPVGATTLGFAIKSFNGNTLTGTFATQNALNPVSKDHVLVYNPSANKYALAFEDLTAAQSSDNDYNDLVVEVTLACQPTTGTLHVVKHVVGSDTSPADFSYYIDEGPNANFEADGTNDVTVSVGTHDVTEKPDAAYTTTYEGCDDINITPGGEATCTITNTLIGQQCEDTNVSHTVVSDTTTMHGLNATVEVDIDPDTAGNQLHSAWTASIPGATWVWSSNPPVDTVNDLTETFTKTFTIAGVPNADATLMIAADNSYSVDVNGNVAVCADAAENNHASADTCVIPQADIHTGSNTLTFTVKNWAQVGGTPQSNPAGLMYKLSYTSNDCAQTSCVAGVNLLANPSFEANTVGAGSWDIFASGSSPLTWIATWLGAPVTGRPAVANAEIQNTGLLGVTASDGSQWTELDSDWFGPSNPGAGPGSVALSQTIPTIPGYTYNVSFDFMPRPGTAAGENKIEALHDAVVGATADETSGAAWSTHSYSFVASGATTAITFRDAGTPDNSLGSFLDKTSVTCVPPVEIPTTATIHATKIVCDSETDLPNWGNGAGPNITESTAADFLENHESCHLEPNWTFQWAPASAGNPGDNITNPASAPWTSLGVTAADGTATVNVPVTDSYVWFREVLKPGYIPFTYGTEGNHDSDSVSAEVYCNVDHLHYDNWDRVDGLVAGNDYYCVAFNALIDNDNGGGDEGHATIHIVKNTTSGNGTFHFGVSGNDFGTSTSITTTGVEGGSGTVMGIEVEEGSYNVTELSQAGWALDSVSCVYDNEAVGNAIAGGEAVSLDDGDEVTCTFTNRPVVDLSENPQCSDGVDNDGDSKTDAGDPGCHSDNDVNNASSYHPEWDNETNADGSTPPGGGGGGGGPLSFSGGGGGGGGGGILGASTSQILGVSCGLSLNQHLRRGSLKNSVEQVKTLQGLLNKYVGSNLPITGFFGPMTEAAVKAFQTKYFDEILKPWGITAPTGLVYLATLWKLDVLECPDATPPFPSSLIPWSANPNAQ